MYLDMVGDLLKKAHILKSFLLLEDEKELTDSITKNGTTLEQFESKLMISMLMELSDR